MLIDVVDFKSSKVGRGGERRSGSFCLFCLQRRCCPGSGWLVQVSLLLYSSLSPSHSLVSLPPLCVRVCVLPLF